MSRRFALFSMAANQKKCRGQKKRQKKSLIPLPPTGFASLFCAKPRGGANHGPAQARCGVCGALSYCTGCKVLQRNVMRLHDTPWRLCRSDNYESPGRLGRELEKHGRSPVFKSWTAPKIAYLVECDRVRPKLRKPSWLQPVAN